MRRTPLLWLAAVLVSGEALATASYPGVVKTETGSSVTPPCTLCHTDNLGGSGTVTQDFGVMLYDRGLRGGQLNTLKTLLQQIHTEKVDTDGDGTTDFDELTVGRNPNVSGAGGANDCFSGSTACGGSNPGTDGGTSTDGGNGGTGGIETPLPDPTYGCSAGAGGGALAGVLLAGTALLSAVRRRRS